MNVLTTGSLRAPGLYLQQVVCLVLGKFFNLKVPVFASFTGPDNLNDQRKASLQGTQSVTKSPSLEIPLFIPFIHSPASRLFFRDVLQSTRAGNINHCKSCAFCLNSAQRLQRLMSIFCTESCNSLAFSANGHQTAVKQKLLFAKP